MPKLSGDLILGMDLWLNFKVLVDPFSQTWILSGSKHHYPLSHSSTVLNELQTLSVNETKRLRKFLDEQFDKSDKESTGETHLIKLNDTTPHRQKPYCRSEIIRKFISEEVNRPLEKGGAFVEHSWSNSEWS